MKNKGSKTTIKAICDYWASIVDETELSVDAADMHERCWNCGCERILQKCHIIPRSRGGEDIPSNLVLLCVECHKNAPDCTNPSIIWDWIKSNKEPFYDIYWWLKASKDYERIYGVSILTELSMMNIESIDILKTAIKREIDNTSMHWGSCGLSTGTRVGVLRSVVTSKEFQRSVA